jgi:hypothetical protein
VTDTGLDEFRRHREAHHLAIDANLALDDRAQPGQHLGELALAVAGGARDADDLAGMDRDIGLGQRLNSAIVGRRDAGELQDDIADLADSALGARLG